MRIALGSDHHGVTLKARIKKALESAGRHGAAAKIADLEQRAEGK